MPYTVDNSHHFFRHISAFALSVCNCIPLDRLFKSARLIQDNPRHPAVLEAIWQLVSRLPILDLEGKVVSITVRETGDIFTALANKQPTSRFVFEEATTLPPMNSDPTREILFGNDYVNGIGALALGAAYESIQKRVKDKHGSDPNSWPKVLEYFRHARNASYHGNTFNIQPPPKWTKKLTAIDPKSPPTWRGSVMPDDATMNKRALMGDFLALGDVVPLLNDVHAQLVKDGISP